MLWAGSGKVSRFISAGLRVPFGGGNYGLLQYMIDDHWTPETAETAKTPRFSGAANANNYTRNSTLWLKDASYIRLKNVQIGYTFKGCLLYTSPPYVFALQGIGFIFIYN